MLSRLKRFLFSTNHKDIGSLLKNLSFIIGSFTFFCLCFLFIYLGFFLECPTVDCVWPWGDKSSKLLSTAFNVVKDSFVKAPLSPGQRLMSHIATKSLLLSDGLEAIPGLQTEWTSNSSFSSHRLPFPVKDDKRLFDIKPEVVTYLPVELDKSILGRKYMHPAYSRSSPDNSLSMLPYISTDRIFNLVDSLKLLISDNNLSETDKNMIKTELYAIRNNMSIFHTKLVSLILNNPQHLTGDFFKNWISKNSIGENSMLYLFERFPKVFPNFSIDIVKDLELINQPLKCKIMHSPFYCDKIVAFYFLDGDYFKVVHETALAHSLENGTLSIVQDSVTGSSVSVFRPAGCKFMNHTSFDISEILFCDFLNFSGSKPIADIIVKSPITKGGSAVTPLQTTIVSGPETSHICWKTLVKFNKYYKSSSDNLASQLAQSVQTLSSSNPRIFSNVGLYNDGALVVGHFNSTLEPFSFSLNNTGVTICPLDFHTIPTIPTTELERDLVGLQDKYFLYFSKHFSSIESLVKEIIEDRY